MFPFSMFLSPPALEVSASNVQGNNSGFAACGAVSSSGDSPDVQVTGGSGSYTYQWTRLSGADGDDFNISSSTVINPVWSGTRCDNFSDNTEQWRVTVTDSVTGRTASATIAVVLFWVNLS